MRCVRFSYGDWIFVWRVLLVVNEIVRGKRGVTPQTAWFFAQALGTTPEFWINLQAAHDLAKNQPKRKVKKLAKAG